MITNSAYVCNTCRCDETDRYGFPLSSMCVRGRRYLRSSSSSSSSENHMQKKHEANLSGSGRTCAVAAPQLPDPRHSAGCRFWSALSCHTTHLAPGTIFFLKKKNKNKNKNKKSVSVRSSFSTATSQCQVAGERVRLLRLEYHLFLKGKTPVDDGSHWAAAG